MTYNILRVEDSSSMRRVMMKMIKMAGLPVTYFEAADGCQGLEQCHYNTTDLIITDLNMPNMDGFAFLKRLQQNPKFKNILSLVVSTEGRSALIQEAFDLGVANYINTPFHAEKIAETLHHALGEEYGFRED